MAGFLGRGLGAAAGGYLAGGVLGLQQQQRQREKDQDQALRQAQIDSLNAQRQASQRDPNEPKKKIADAFLNQLLKDDFDPNMQAALQNTRGVKESREAARRYVSEFYTNKRDWSEFDPTALSGIVGTIDQLRSSQQPGVPALGGEQPAAPPLGGTDATAKLGGEMQGSVPPGLAAVGRLPLPGMPPALQALGGLPSGDKSANLSPVVGPFDPRVMERRRGNDPSFAYEKQVGTAPGALGEKGVRPAAPAPRPAPKQPEQRVTPEELTREANDYYRELRANPPTIEQVVAEMPYDTPDQQRKEFDRRQRNYRQDLRQAAQDTLLYNKQAVGAADAASRSAKNAADIQRSLAAAGFSEAQTVQAMKLMGLKAGNITSQIKDREKRTQIAAAAERRQADELTWKKAAKEVDQATARLNALTAQRRADISDRAQKAQAARIQALNGNLNWLQKNGKIPKELAERLKTARAEWRLTWIKDPSGSGAMIPGPGAAEAKKRLDALVNELGSHYQQQLAGGEETAAAAPLGGGRSVTPAQLAGVKAALSRGTFDSQMRGLQSSNPDGYAILSRAYQQIKGKPYKLPAR